MLCGMMEILCIGLVFGSVIVIRVCFILCSVMVWCLWVLSMC